MLDEKRIRQMTKLAFFEKKEEKNALRIGRYFRSDYIGKELLKNFFLASIGYILVLAVAVLYHIEWLDRKSTRLNSSHSTSSRMPSSA